jgi:flagellin
VAENLDAQTQSLRQARRNTNDGVSVIQTIEGATNETANVVKRMRELAVEASSETLNSTERAYIQTEFGALKSEVDRIAKVTEFNGINLATAAGNLAVQVGIHNTGNDRIDIATIAMTTAALGVTTALQLSTAGKAQSAITYFDGALDKLNSHRAKLGSTQNRLGSALNNLEVYTENMQSAESQIRDADFAHETAEMAKLQIMAQAGTSVLAQANQINQGALRLL